MVDRSKLRTCPICKQLYKGHPAISRYDNVTEICPECGLAEAMWVMHGFPLKKPHKQRKKNTR